MGFLRSFPLGSRPSDSTKSTWRGHLKCASRSRQNSISSRASSAPGAVARVGLDHRGDFLAPLVTRRADHGGVGDRGMSEQHVLHLGGVDVHASGDDHVGLAVAEEQVAVVVDVPDVADRVELALAVCCRLVRVVVVVELPHRLAQVDEAGHTRRALVAVVVEDPEHDG